MSRNWILTTSQMYWVTSRQSVWVMNKCTFQNNYINLISSQISQIIRIVIKASTKDKNVKAVLYFWKKFLKVTFTASVQDHRHRRNVHVPVFFTSNLALSPSPILARFFAADEITCVWVCLFYRVHILWYYHQPAKQQERNNTEKLQLPHIKNILHTTEIQTKTKSGISL